MTKLKDLFNSILKMEDREVYNHTMKRINVSKNMQYQFLVQEIIF